MRTWTRRWLLGTAALGALSAACGSDRGARSAEELTAEGSRLYRAGRFPQANRAFRQGLAVAPDHFAALVGAGRTALLSNDLAAADRWLRRAVDRDPHHLAALQDLADVAYRRDDFSRASELTRRLAAASGEDREVVATKLAAFGTTLPNRVDGGGRDVRVPFLVTDPLPVVNVQVGDGLTVPFFVDTGGPEVFVDQTLMREQGFPGYGSAPITGVGGKQGTSGHGRLPVMELGGLRVHDVPVTTLDFAGQGIEIGGIPFKGAIGTAFLYHFLATIDYPGAVLELRPKTASRLRSFERQAGSERQHVVPFWQAAPHYHLAWGTVNGEPMLLFADTGGAGIGFLATEETVKQARIKLRDDQAAEGPGAGGTVRTVPFELAELTLGTVTGKNLPGQYSGPGLDEVLRKDGVVTREYRIGGMISHQFFRPYRLTFDFVGMRLFLG